MVVLATGNAAAAALAAGKAVLVAGKVLGVGGGPSHSHQ